MKEKLIGIGKPTGAIEMTGFGNLSQEQFPKTIIHKYQRHGRILRQLSDIF